MIDPFSTDAELTSTKLALDFLLGLLSGGNDDNANNILDNFSDATANVDMRVQLQPRALLAESSASSTSASSVVQDGSSSASNLTNPSLTSSPSPYQLTSSQQIRIGITAGLVEAPLPEQSPANDSQLRTLGATTAGHTRGTLPGTREASPALTAADSPLSSTQSDSTLHPTNAGENDDKSEDENVSELSDSTKSSENEFAPAAPATPEQTLQPVTEAILRWLSNTMPPPAGDHFQANFGTRWNKDEETRLIADSAAAGSDDSQTIDSSQPSDDDESDLDSLDDEEQTLLDETSDDYFLTDDNIDDSTELQALPEDDSDSDDFLSAETDSSDLLNSEESEDEGDITTDELNEQLTDQIADQITDPLNDQLADDLSDAEIEESNYDEQIDAPEEDDTSSEDISEPLAEDLSEESISSEDNSLEDAASDADGYIDESTGGEESDLELDDSAAEESIDPDALSEADNESDLTISDETSIPSDEPYSEQTADTTEDFTIETLSSSETSYSMSTDSTDYASAWSSDYSDDSEDSSLTSSFADSFSELPDSSTSSGDDSFWLQITTTAAAQDLTLWQIKGIERLSTPFDFTFICRSSSFSLALGDLIGQAATATLRLRSGQGQYDMRYISGIITNIEQSPPHDLNSINTTEYQLRIRPQLWLASLTKNYRIFQHQTALDIIHTLLQENNITFQDSTTVRGLRPREYCVQYDESDFSFMSRLMEEEGIFYFFQHNSNEHIMVLGDDSSIYQDCLYAETLSYVPAHSGAFLLNTLISVVLKQNIVPKTYALADYNFETPSTALYSEISGEGKGGRIYDYPGVYQNPQDGDELINLRIEGVEVYQSSITGESTSPFMTSGYRFTMQQFPRPDANRGYILYEIEHHAELDPLDISDRPRPIYTNKFVAIPDHLPFRPPLKTPKPRIYSTQTAVVTGVSGEEIYIDDYARIKVHFFWDQYNSFDENSSCWIRVAQGFAGYNWGGLITPRIGQEVVVTYLDGDPDRPLITGSVYNADNMPPYGPDEKTMTTIKSNSSISDSGMGFNEFRFNDLFQQEEVFLHAERDYNTIVRTGSRSAKINAEESDPGNDSLLIVRGDMSLEIDQGNQTNMFKLGSQSTTLLMGSQSNTIITGSQSDTIMTGSRSVTVTTGMSSHMVMLGTYGFTLMLGMKSSDTLLGMDSTSVLLGIHAISDVMLGMQTSNLGKGKQTNNVVTDTQIMSLETGEQTFTVVAGMQNFTIMKGIQNTLIQEGNQNTTLMKGLRTVTIQEGGQIHNITGTRLDNTIGSHKIIVEGDLTIIASGALILKGATVVIG